MVAPVATIPDVDGLASAWAERSDISARSVLVTMLGDTIAPLGGECWLSDLIALAEPFGYNDRLVRTSMFRLVSESWVANQRIGRRSRYALTEFGMAEVADASTRIYRRATPGWDGAWTLAFLAEPPEAELRRQLRWHGFAAVDRSVYAMPNADVPGARALFDRLGIEPRPLVAHARFDEIGAASGFDPFRAASGLDRAEAAYGAFVDRYAWIPTSGARLTPREAFLARTMLVHDLRRTRLSDPDLPAAMLPADWIGHRAMDLAASSYQALESAWTWVESATGLAVDVAHPMLTRRFADVPHTPTADPASEGTARP